MRGLAFVICLVASTIPSVTHAGPEAIRTCMIGTADQLRAYLKTVTSEADREAIVGTAKPLAAGRGGDCGITAVSETCDLIVAFEGTEPPAVIIGVGAPDGPMLQTTAALDFLAASSIPLSSIVLHHVDQVQDQELLALITADVREVISQKGFDGAGRPVCQCGPDCGPKSEN